MSLWRPFLPKPLQLDSECQPSSMFSLHSTYASGTVSLKLCLKGIYSCVLILGPVVFAALNILRPLQVVLCFLQICLRSWTLPNMTKIQHKIPLEYLCLEILAWHQENIFKSGNWCWSNGSVIKAPDALQRRLVPSHTSRSSQQLVTPAPGNPISASGTPTHKHTHTCLRINTL